MTTRTVRSPLLLLLLPGLLAGGCDDCGGKSKAVPFKRNQALVGRDAGGANAGAPSMAAPTVRTLEEPAAEVEIGAARITLPEHRIAAAVSHDVSGDGKADALLLTSDEQGAIRLHTFLGEESGGLRATQAPPLMLWQQPGCEVGVPRAKALSGRHLLVHAEIVCPAASTAEAGAGQADDDANAPHTPTGAERPDPYDLPAPDAVDPGSAPPAANPGELAGPAELAELTGLTGPMGGEPRTHFWIVTLQRTPRQLESLELPADAQRLSGSFSGPDADSDGHPDVRLDLAVRLTPDDEAEHLSVTWLNRPSGLGFDAAQPEATLLSLADAARAQLHKDAGRAEAAARRVLALHDLLCRGGAAPALVVGGLAGLPCGRSIARARAVSVLVAALAGGGRLIEALAQRAELKDGPTQDVRKVDRERAEAALASYPGLEGYVITRGPALRSDRRPRVHASRLRFDDEKRIHVLSPSPSVYTLQDGVMTPSTGEETNLLTSVDQRFAVTDVFRDCDGYRLRVMRASEVIAGVEAGSSVAEPLIARAPPPAGARCPEVGAAMREDDGGFGVLRWSGGGVVLLRHGAASVLPMGDDGKPTAALQSLSRLEPANLARHVPAPLRNHVPVVTKLGIALLDLNVGRADLLRMESVAGVSDASVSPSGKLIAFTRDGHLWVAQPGPKPGAVQPVNDAGPAGP